MFHIKAETPSDTEPDMTSLPSTSTTNPSSELSKDQQKVLFPEYNSADCNDDLLLKLEEEFKKLCLSNDDNKLFKVEEIFEKLNLNDQDETKTFKDDDANLNDQEETKTFKYDD